MRSTFKVLFYLKKNAPKKNGNVPVMCRITLNGQIAQFSCKCELPPAIWDAESKRAKGRSAAAADINSILDSIRVGINMRYRELRELGGYVSAAKLKDAFLGLDKKPETLLGSLAQHNAEFSKGVGTIRSQATYNKYLTVYKHLKEFVSLRYHTRDIALREIGASFITEFELFLRRVKRCCNNTVWIYMMPLKRVIAQALGRGELSCNPFLNYRISPEKTAKGYLNKDDIQLLLSQVFDNGKLELSRDLFIFCCFTGLSYADLKNLTGSSLQTSLDGHLWLNIRRQKTGTESDIMLLDIPRKILKKYEGLCGDGRLLPVPSYATLSRALQKIVSLCGIQKRVTWHLARHTMATAVCLANGLPIETLSKILGHTNIRTTQIYAKLTREKESKDMAALSERLSSVRQFSSPGI